MKGYTHLNCGIALSLAVCGDIINGVWLAVGSILPDVDSKNSLLGKSFPFIPKIIKHRTLTHSVIFIAASFMLNKYLAIGCALHIFLDMMTKMGCPLLYPIRYNVRLPLAGFVKTGGKFETFIFILSTFLIIILLANKILHISF